MKAFLSHSSLEKVFVEAVAKELGRQFCVFDKQAFITGEDFQKSIEQGLDESSVFVLFASANALKSIWVEFEIEEAWYRKLYKNLSKGLVYLIDSSIEVDNLPKWMQRALIKRANSPKFIARDIRSHLDELLRIRQYPHFVGRSNKVDDLEKVLTPLDGSPLPHMVFVTGLPGIGRRSIIRRTSPSILNLRKFIEIKIGESDSINDICIKVADHIEPYSTRDGLERIINKIRALSNEDALKRIMTNLREIVGGGELPIFIDEGGILDSEGYIREPIQSIIQELAPNDEAYIFLISSRKPHWTLGGELPVVYLEHLPRKETMRLISLLANEAKLTISQSDIEELAEYVAGYPPSAYFAIQQAKNYGLQLVMQYKYRLVQFRTSVFLKHFSKLSISEKEQELLRLLAFYSPLPLPVISQFLSMKLADFDTLIMNLIDLSLITINQDGYYSIADPVTDAAINAFGLLSEDQHKHITKSLFEFIKKVESSMPLLDLSRVLFRAARWSKDEEIANETIHLSNDLIKLTEDSYHAGRFDDALAFGVAALEERPESVTARSFLIRAFIQNERWDEAQDQIKQIVKYAATKEVYFLKGFLERRRNNIPAAIDAYKESEKLGRKGIALNRELALCYHLQKDHKEAFRYIKKALTMHGDNRYVIDLYIKIATSQKDEKEARQALSRLELVDRPIFYYHRLSRVESSFGNLTEARDAAKRASECESSPPFEILANLANCEIEVGNTNETEKILDILDKRFAKIRSDIRLALRCRLEIARNNYNEALAISEKINDKSTLFYKNIRRYAISGELRTSALSDKIRATYEEELIKLDAELENIRAEEFIPPEFDITL
jgi:tetratricopeptide (TPR) repeat protein